MTCQLQNNLTDPYFLFSRHPTGTIFRPAPDSVRLLVGLDQGMTARETSRPDTCAGIKLKLLDSLKQRERNYIRQLLFCNTVQGTRHHILHAYIPPLMLSKPGQPRNLMQIYKFCALYDLC